MVDFAINFNGYDVCVNQFFESDSHIHFVFRVHPRKKVITLVFKDSLHVSCRDVAKCLNRAMPIIRSFYGF